MLYQFLQFHHASRFYGAVFVVASVVAYVVGQS